MSRFSSLRARLLLLYVGLSVLGFGGLTIWAGQQMATSTYQDYGRNLQVNALALATTLVESLEHVAEGEASLASLSVWVQRTATNLEAEVTILDLEGGVLLSSDPAVPASFRNQPEVEAALQGTVTFDVRLDVAGEACFYTAVPVVDDDGHTVGYVHLATSATGPQETVRERWLGLGLAFVTFLVVGLAASLWLIATFTRPLAELQTAALNMAGGALHERIKVPGADEVGAVAVAFNEMATRVEQMVAEQRAFAGNAAHELRTPLTTMRLRVEALEDGDLDEATRAQYIHEIDGELLRLSGLVDDLILLSRLDAQRLEVGQAEIDMVRLWRRVGRDLVQVAEDKEIAVDMSLPEQQLLVQAHQNHLQVVCRNMLDNAIKYTPAGGTVSVTLQEVGGRVQWQVQDNGIGIAATDLPQIGRRFFRADKGRSRKTAGVGLGLALVGSIVELYGGEWQIESEGEGQGTRVVVWWPCGESTKKVR